MYFLSTWFIFPPTLIVLFPFARLDLFSTKNDTQQGKTARSTWTIAHCTQVCSQIHGTKLLIAYVLETAQIMQIMFLPKMMSSWVWKSAEQLNTNPIKSKACFVLTCFPSAICSLISICRNQKEFKIVKFAFLTVLRFLRLNHQSYTRVVNGVKWELQGLPIFC